VLPGCCRALKLATTPSLSMHMRCDVVRRQVDGVVAATTATPLATPAQLVTGLDLSPWCCALKGDIRESLNKFKSVFAPA
jgi:hypothetical protein